MTFAPAKRRPMTAARKRRIWERDCGVCFYRCGVPVPPPPAKGVVYHHFPLLAFMEEDLDEKVHPAHKACDARPENTPRDISSVAKAKRIARKRDPETRPKSARPIKGRGFSSNLTRGFDGKVRPRRSRPVVGEEGL